MFFLIMPERFLQWLDYERFHLSLEGTIKQGRIGFDGFFHMLSKLWESEEELISQRCD